MVNAQPVSNNGRYSPASATISVADALNAVKDKFNDVPFKNGTMDHLYTRYPQKESKENKIRA